MSGGYLLNVPYLPPAEARIYSSGQPVCILHHIFFLNNGRQAGSTGKLPSQPVANGSMLKGWMLTVFFGPPTLEQASGSPPPSYWIHITWILTGDEGDWLPGVCPSPSFKLQPPLQLIGIQRMGSQARRHASAPRLGTAADGLTSTSFYLDVANKPSKHFV